MLFPLLLLLTFANFPNAGATCPCSGIVLNGSDSIQHCWQIESRSESTWTDADESCMDVGGHIGNPTDDVFASVLSYVLNTSSLPVLTGFVSGIGGNVTSFAQMCQENSVYNENFTSTSLFSNSPSNDSTCVFFSNSSSLLVFLDCNITASVLCDRPLDTEDYCGIKANCSSTTTLLSTTTVPSTTTSNATSSTSSTTQSNSSTSTGTSSVSDTTTSLAGSSSTSSPASSSASSSKGSSTSSSASSSTKASGSGSSTCTCASSEVTTTAATATTTACSESSGCLAHQWKILGMCVDWRAVLALIAIGLLLFLCCCICHFCMNACMFCTPAAKKERVFRDPILQNTSVIAPAPLVPLAKKVDYDVEKSVVLPPAAVQPEPVPEKHESVYGFHTKEIIHVMPDKPATREIGTMTDPMEIVTPVMPVDAPAIKRKKAIKKPKKMFIPATLDPMESIEEDLGDEIPIDMPQSPGSRSVAPLGDVVEPSPPSAPLNFVRNPKPMVPVGKAPHEGGENTPPRAAATAAKPNNRDEFDPRGLRSPPPPVGRNNADGPRRMTFSPIADDSDEDAGARIPSPPRERKGPRNNEKPDSEAQRASLKNKRLNELPSPVPGDRSANAPAAPARSASSNPFASLGGSSPAPEQGGAERGPEDDVGMRAARGRLGGAVRGGGGGGEAPTGWKPWAAKGGARR